MTRVGSDQGRDLLAEASDWVVRLANDVDQDTALDFDRWLDASVDHARAFDAVLNTSLSYSRHREALAELGSERRRSAPQRRWMLAAGGAIAAAALAAILVVPQISRQSVQVFETAHGERRQLTLADGTSLHLNGATHLSVRFDGEARKVVLDRGEVVFDVVHNADRPFFVTAGDRTVRVVGTQFDVRRISGNVSVTVSRGAVEVRPNSGPGATYRLHPGQKLDHFEGQSEVKVSAVEPAEVMGWRSGRLVLRDKALSDVVDDLNQQFAIPLRIEDPALAALPVSGVLVLDAQDAVIRRLALLAPVRAVRSDAGIVLRWDAEPDR